jgi:uncharacterized protein YdbL (DUF1318 family)
MIRIIKYDAIAPSPLGLIQGRVRVGKQLPQLVTGRGTRAQARNVIKEVATATASWREVAKSAGAKASEINRVASAFEHDDSKRAQAL